MKEGARGPPNFGTRCAWRLAGAVVLPYTSCIISSQVIPEYNGAESQTFPSEGRVPFAQYAEVVLIVHAEGAANEACCLQGG